MLLTIRVGLLHTDAHAGNFFVHFRSTSRYPEIVLGDWGSYEIRPDGDSSDCELQRWFESAHIAIITHIVATIRGFILSGEPMVGRSQKDRLRYLVDINHDYFGTLASLTRYMEELEDSSPSKFSDGDAWLAHVADLYNDYEKIRPTQSDTPRVAQYHQSMRYGHILTLPSYEDAMIELERLHSDVPACSWVSICDLWLDADLDPLNRIVGLRRPPAFSWQYNDDTSQSELSVIWCRAHDATRQLVERLLPEEYNLQSGPIITAI